MRTGNKYVTAWGMFEIPAEIFDRTEFEKRTGWPETPTFPKATPENWEFLKWLDDQEIQAGKPRK